MAAGRKSRREQEIMTIADTLAQKARVKGIGSEVLDDKVYDLACEGAKPIGADENDQDEDVTLDDAERTAAEVNSNGLEEQISLILGTFEDLEEGQQDVQNLLGLK